MRLTSSVGDKKMRRNEYALPVGEKLVVKDDAAARRIIAEIGLLDAIEKAKRCLTEPAVFVTSQNHSTHWIVAGFYRGFQKPEDNGFYLACYPKTDFTFEQVQSHIHLHLNNTYIEIETSPQQPPAN
jgi:hypothetical protein